MSSGTRSDKTVAAVQPDNYTGGGRIAPSIGAVLAYAPFGWWIGAAYPTFAIIGGVLAVAVASAPDVLTAVGLPKRWTHSLVGTFAIGGLLAAAGWWFTGEVFIYAGRRLVTSLAAAEYGFMIGMLSASGHVLANGLTGSDIHPLWPVTDRHGSVDFLPLIDLRENEGFNFVGSLAVVAIVSSVATATLFPL